ncbi:MAG TPA: DUF4091 domain-containing protein [Armatimonadetes bacterium]|nr:DUF4091 domain-containing protein [Armatimonadota bacterium]
MGVSRRYPSEVSYQMLIAALVVWAVDPMVKVFPNTLPPANPTTVIRIVSARNEYEPAQFAIRSTRDLSNVTVEITPLVHEAGKFTIGTEHVNWNFVGFVRIEHNTPATPESELICKAPCEVPDPLLEIRSMDIPANRTQPVWITVFVPHDAPSGLYRGEVRVIAGDERIALPIELTVYPFALPNERHLYVTNWFNINNIAKAHNVELWSEAFWQVLEAYARNMAEHRQNVFWVSIGLIEVYREPNGKLSFDYSRFDRYIELFMRAGVNGRIEIQHVAHHGKGGWSSREVILRTITATDRKTGNRIQLSPQEGLGPLLADLQRHLEQRGWLDKAMIHVCDEPSVHNIDAWRKASEFVHRYAPRIKRIDAIETIYFENALEIWVPKLSHLRNWYEHFKAAQANGYEMWYYICCHPMGYYINRFLDCSLSKVRLLHWLNYRYQLSGYLHWGWNFWGKEPFGPPARRLPPGDTHIVYPGKAGPLNSIRWEIQRDSIEDYEYLWLLEHRVRKVQAQLGEPAQAFEPKRRSMEYCRRLIRHFTDYVKDPTVIQQTRQELAREIVAMEQRPLIIWETVPSAETVLVPAPIVVVVQGVTELGARVRVNGRDVQVASDGSFRTHVSMSARNQFITLEVERNGHRKIEMRRFGMRRL